MAQAFIAFGSNLGKRKENINQALEFLKAKCEIIKISKFYETKPVGYLEQNNFLNGAVLVKTELKPDELMQFLLEIEKKLKRKREVKNGPRTIDLDIIFYEKKIIKAKKLTIPHPRAHERLFVLGPLAELSPDFIHPVFKKNISRLISELD